MRSWSLLVLFVSGLGACEGPVARAELGTAEQPIAGGSVDLEHDSVFALFTHLGDYGSFCSGTLIAPNLMLTARHCVSQNSSSEVVCGESEFTTPLPGENVYVTNDPAPGQDSVWFRGSSVHVPNEGADTCGFDVALIILAGTVPLDVALPAVPRIDREVAAGEPYVAIGYGDTSDGAQSGGTRMIRDGLEVQCAPGSCPYGIESTEFLGETGICSGDSGGPALDEQGKVVGVVSRGSDGCDTPIYGTVTAWRDWLMETAVRAAEFGAYQAPSWALSGSSDLPAQGGGGGGDGSSAPGQDGDACDQAADCAGGFACYFESEPSDAVCRASCTESSQCSGDQTCRSLGSGAGVCVHGDDSESSCSVAPGRSGESAPFALVLGLGAAAVMGLRRRRS